MLVYGDGIPRDAARSDPFKEEGCLKASRPLASYGLRTRRRSTPTPLASLQHNGK